MNRKVDELVGRILRRCVQQSNSVTSQLDEDVRVCYATLNMNSYEKVVQFLIPFQHRMENSLYDFNSGLRIEPNNVELLYSKAVALRELNRDINETIAAYETFLSVAPKDHRKVSEAYYAMGICCFRSDLSHNPIDLMKTFYMKGK